MRDGTLHHRKPAVNASRPRIGPCEYRDRILLPWNSPQLTEAGDPCFHSSNAFLQLPQFTQSPAAMESSPWKPLGKAVFLRESDSLVGIGKPDLRFAPNAAEPTSH